MNNEQIYEIPEISDIRLLDIDTDAEWDKLSSQLGFKRKTKILRIDMLIKIAAAVLIVVGLGTLINSSINNSGISTFSAQNAPVETVKSAVYGFSEKSTTPFPSAFTSAAEAVN